MQGECSATGKYWWNLNAAPDVESLKSLLITKFGFQEQNIKILATKQETTHKNIVDTFKSFLIDQTKRGDIVYFHYSGHGSQVLDDGSAGSNLIAGDEIDGLDECLVPSDYVSLRDGSNNIRDDEIGALLARLKNERAPGSVTVTMDSCFSGTNTRGGEHLVRGLAWNGPLPKSHLEQTPESATGLFTRGIALQQGYVILAATNDRQLAGETNCKGKSMGLFTCALVQSLNEAGDNTSYREIFEKINDQVTKAARNQNPQFEGNLDQRVMKLGAVSRQPYVLVKAIGARLTLSAGRLQGMTVGSRFNIYSQSADPDSAKPVAQAEVARVDLTTSDLKLIDNSGPASVPQNLHLTRAVETLHNFGDQRLRVDIGDLPRAANGQQAIQLLTAMKLVNTSLEANQTPQVRICRGRCSTETGAPKQRGENMVTLMREDGSTLSWLADNSSLADEIRKSLEAEARWRYVKDVLRNEDKYIKIKFRLVPVELEKPPKCAEGDPNCDPTKPLPVQTVNEGGQTVLYEGDLVQLEFLNTGSLPAYVTVMDLRSDGTIGPIWPHPDVPLGSAEENLIPVSRDGQWKRLPWQFTIKITKPFGPEMFKAIATRVPADFSALLNPPTANRSVRGGGLRGNERGMAEANTEVGKLLLSAVAENLTRGDLPYLNLASLSVTPSNWATSEITFEARPRN
jgi:hypothetical protein